ncbi:MAG: globin domain-containing protein [Pikeienuella sp.]
MDQDTVNLIRESWAKAAAAHVDTARLFYGKLFKIAPDTRALFKNDLAQQGRKLVATLSFIIDHLADIDTLVPAAQDLAIRHLSYDVKSEHYSAVGESLVWTLRQMLGADFDAATEKAWVDVLGVLEGVMIEAAYPEKTR